MMFSPIGILANIVWSVVSSIMSDRKADDLRHRQNKDAGRATVERDDLFDSQAAEVIAIRRSLFDCAGATIDAASTHAVLDAVQAWIYSELAQLPPPKAKSDHSLMADLMANWVLQHSESPDEANDETADNAYDDALDSPMVATAVKSGKQILFVHQLKHGLHRHGLMDHGVCNAVERNARIAFDSKGVNSAVAQANGLRIDLPRAPIGSQGAVFIGPRSMIDLGRKL